MNITHETNQLDMHPRDWNKKVVEMTTDLNDMSENDLHKYFNRFRYKANWLQRFWDWIRRWKTHWIGYFGV